MQLNPHELTRKFLEELGVKNAGSELVQKAEDHFAKVVLEVLLRRFPEDKLDQLQEKFEQDSPDLEEFVAQAAATIPGLALELEEAILREREVLRHLMYRD